MKNKQDRKDKRVMVTALVLALAIIAIFWELTGVLTAQQSAETPKQFLAALLLCWLVFTLFRKPLDDDDWAGQY